MKRLERQKLQKKVELLGKEIKSIFLGLGGNIMIFCALFFFTIPVFIHIGIGMCIFLFAFLGIIVSAREDGAMGKLNTYRRKLDKERCNFHIERILEFVKNNDIDSAVVVHNFVIDNIDNRGNLIYITKGLITGLRLNSGDIETIDKGIKTINDIKEELK